jgi:hypothetical protein
VTIYIKISFLPFFADSVEMMMLMVIIGVSMS